MQPNHSNNTFEDQIRKMFNSGATQSVEDTTPKVRLPPPQSYPHHQASNLQPMARNQAPAIGQWPNGSPISQQGHSLPQERHSQQHPSRQVIPPHQRHHQYQPNTDSPPPPRQYVPPHPSSRGGHMQGYQGRGQPSGHAPQRQQRRQQIQLDPNAFNRTGPTPSRGYSTPHSRGLFNPHANRAFPQNDRNEYRERQAVYLQQLASSEVQKMEMSQKERAEKEAFREVLQDLCEEVRVANSKLPKVSLQCFGSFQSGFASAGSDMDLVIVVDENASSPASFSLMEDDLPRELEMKLLSKGHGARLLTRTRVPIIKVCEKPSQDLLGKLRDERMKCSSLSEGHNSPHLVSGNDDELEIDLVGRSSDSVQQADQVHHDIPSGPVLAPLNEPMAAVPKQDSSNTLASTADPTEPPTDTVLPVGQDPTSSNRETPRTWTRERKRGPLDFPKDGVGIQCDINFFNPLGLHNTQMLRCYSLCDPRVRPMVLFVKSWAKVREVNSSYSGTLSSYGYVLMMLHYLMNVANPPVIPNLQASWRPNAGCTSAGANACDVDGWRVDFWRNEDEITAAVQNGQMSRNHEAIGSLLLGFFQYYASQGRGPKFHWMNEVLSLRSQNGILTKAEKGWVRAVTEEGEGKRIQHRYLFCIEDPFELNHNVARTVTHNGIVAIRDEFRRANRILHAVGSGLEPNDGHLLSTLTVTQDLINATSQLNLSNIAAPQPQPDSESQIQTSGATHQRGPVGSSGHTRAPTHQPQSQALNLADQELFPSLGMPSTKKSKQNGGPRDRNGHGSIGGDRAQAYLEEFRRKKAEEEAEHTAMEAAEAVLNGDE